MAADSEVVSDYEVLHGNAGAVTGERDVLKVSGTDAQSYLDGQLSQDIAALATGKSAWSFILQPTGKVDVYCRVFRSQSRDEAVFFVEVPSGWGKPALSRLQRFKLRVDCQIEFLKWQLCAIRGPKSTEIMEMILSKSSPQTLVATVEWGEVSGFDLLGPEFPSFAAISECSSSTLEALRIEAGIPQMGKDIAEGAIPAEIGNRILRDAVSLTKGCYVGQELVARVDSRGGNAPRRLLGVMFENPDADLSAVDFSAPEAGKPLYEASGSGRQVGILTSVAYSPRLGSIGLALVHRSVEPSAKLVYGDVSARVMNLPFPNELPD